jgi:serine/threonine protein kinase
MPSDLQNNIARFVRRQDYRIVEELGQGGCGLTMLLHDEVIDESIVCKKYTPADESQRELLFLNFKREIKLLHKVFHKNVVRIFNYYIYEDLFAGYILMEYVRGSNIDDHLFWDNDAINDVFGQTIEGFAHLESRDILHRDIRPGNIMVSDEGVVKIIDLGFGKAVEAKGDFDKSISLNWWCETPMDFNSGVYDFSTEVYFVGKLFELLIEKYSIGQFKYKDVLAKMCVRDPNSRTSSFAEVERQLHSSELVEMEFHDDFIQVYQSFSDELHNCVTKAEAGLKYTQDVDQILLEMEKLARACRLERYIADVRKVTRLFLDGTYYYRKQGFPVEVFLPFVRALKGMSGEHRKIVLANLQCRLDSVERYAKPAEPEEDDMPF